jgi:hypothetical protein
VKVSLQTLKKDEGSEGDRGTQLRVMDEVGNEVGSFTASSRMKGGTQRKQIDE